MTITERAVVAPPGAICFSCNQSFDGNPVAYGFDTDLLPAAQAAELRGLVFHQGHFLHYARRRGWTTVVAALTAGDAPKL